MDGRTTNCDNKNNAKIFVIIYITICYNIYNLIHEC